VRVVVPDYPFWDNEVITEDAVALDEAAARYGGDDSAEFLFGWLPRRVFGQRQAPGVGLWMLYLSGYFGGVWLRGVIEAAQPGTSQLAGVAIPPTEESFRAMVAAAASGIDAAAEGAHDALAHCAEALPQLAQSLGYNRGYFLEIAPDATLDDFTPVSEFSPDLQAAHDAAVETGRSVWSSGLSTRGFTSDDLARLLSVSASFLEIIEQTTRSAARAVARGDSDLARGAAIANALTNVWLAAYSTGLLEDRRPPELPALVA
jgi:hypothetical protein